MCVGVCGVWGIWPGGNSFQVCLWLNKGTDGQDRNVWKFGQQIWLPGQELIQGFMDQPSDVFSVLVRVVTAAMVLFVEELR